jgi:hypothetical protein
MILEGPDPFRDVVRAQQEWMLEKAEVNRREREDGTSDTPANESVPAEAEPNNPRAEDIATEQPSQEFQAIVEELRREVLELRAERAQWFAQVEVLPAYENGEE